MPRLFRVLCVLCALAAPPGPAAAQIYSPNPFESTSLDPPSYGPGLAPVTPIVAYRAGTLACPMHEPVHTLAGGTRAMSCFFDSAVPSEPVLVTVTVGKAGPAPHGLGYMTWIVMLAEGADASWIGGDYISDGNRMIGGSDGMVRLVPYALPGMPIINMAPFVRTLRVGT